MACICTGVGMAQPMLTRLERTAREEGAGEVSREGEGDRSEFREAHSCLAVATTESLARGEGHYHL